MTLRFEDIRWEGLFRKQFREFDYSEFAPFHRGQSVLVTGAGGSIGAALSRALLPLGLKELVLLDSSEQNLYYIDRELAKVAGETGVVPVLGSVADQPCVTEVFKRHRPQLVYHAAALKHVPLGEKNPFAVVENNVFGTAVVAKVARDYGAERHLMVSTDKSVNPESIMGACKKLAEMLLYAGSDENTRMTSIRLGNVLGSEGSVVPLFLQQIANGGPVTVTDPKVERYFLSIEDTVYRVMSAMADCPSDSAIAVPILDDPIRIADLARYLITQTSTQDPAVTFTGLRQGDKLIEEFVAADETVLCETRGALRWVGCQPPRLSELERGLTQLAAAVEQRDLPALLEALMGMVPDYRPSECLREQIEAAQRQ